MTFTIIIPVFNHQDYLAEAIESALDQTVKAEVIVINDGSTDKSGNIAEAYKERGVKVVHQVNKGLASARNTGILNATGDYILPLDADDILMEDCIEQMSKAAEETKSDVIACSFKNFGLNNQEIILNGIPSIEDFLTGNRLGYFSAIKKSVFLETGGYNPRMSLGYEDWDEYIDIFKRQHSLTILQKTLVLYRVKEVSMLTRADQHRDLLVSQMKRNHPSLPW